MLSHRRYNVLGGTNDTNSCQPRSTLSKADPSYVFRIFLLMHCQFFQLREQRKHLPHGLTRIVRRGRFVQRAECKSARFLCAYDEQDDDRYVDSPKNVNPPSFAHDAVLVPGPSTVTVFLGIYFVVAAVRNVYYPNSKPTSHVNPHSFYDLDHSEFHIHDYTAHRPDVYVRYRLHDSSSRLEYRYFERLYRRSVLSDDYCHDGVRGKKNYANLVLFVSFQKTRLDDLELDCGFWIDRIYGVEKDGIAEHEGHLDSGDVQPTVEYVDQSKPIKQMLTYSQRSSINILQHRYDS